MLTPEQIQELCSHLQGTCTGDISDVKELFGISENDLTQDDLYEIDSRIFRCDICGWWHESGEETEKENDGQVCQSCEDEI